MKTSLNVLTALLLAGAMHIQSTQAELQQRQLAPEVSVALALGAPPPPGSGSEERFETG